MVFGGSDLQTWLFEDILVIVTWNRRIVQIERLSRVIIMDEPSVSVPNFPKSDPESKEG